MNTPESTLKSYASAQKAANSARFFKTGAGQYGEGDVFLGVTVPECRLVAKQFKDLELAAVIKLLHSKYHECRLTALIIMVNQFKRADAATQKQIYDAYLTNTDFINNWDLVDTSAEFIVGPYLGENYAPTLTRLARSKDMWERRIAMLACFSFIKQGNPDPAFEIIELLKNDPEDLLQKAVGWMLREIGKRCSRSILESWLLNNNEYTKLPRTTLRYAIEHFSPEERQAFLKGTA